MKKDLLILLLLCTGFSLLFAQTNDDTVIKVTSEGNVGINESNPDKQLVINGETVVNDTVTSNGLVVNGTTHLNGDITVGGVENAHVPSGVVVMWYGDPDNVPEGWVLCDGRAYTNSAGNVVSAPDLQGRFIVGYDSDNSDYSETGATGGSDTIELTIDNLPEHDHTGTTDNDGSHTHGYADVYHSEKIDYGFGNYTSIPGGLGSQETDYDNVGHQTSRTTNSGGTHQHTFHTNVTGGGQPHENRPAYFVLVFIIKQ